ncbi:MAG: Rieske 2Fe-2S domain-containing protein [Planctomycetes bacterium]|nr:Rieske 2Fe-2S domain-containing protein [Planctomycetota bacterium]
MTRWLAVGRADELKFAPGAPVKVEGRWLAVFPLEGGYVALDNPCPHAGAPLCDGTVLGGKVVCFLHCWEFDLRTGRCDVGKEWSVATYPVRVVDGMIEVGAEPTPSEPNP